MTNNEPTNKLHLGIYGVLKNNGNILLVKKIRGPYTGLYDLPGGKMEHGEQITEGLKREFIEETGVIVSKSELLCALVHNETFTYEGELISMHQVGIIHTVKDFDDSNIIEDMHEEDSAGAIWIPIEECTRDKLSPFAYKAINL
jgi:8-oxo-dGTP diphosphatase